MTAARLDRPDWRIWIASAAFALAAHASFALKLAQWQDPVPGDDGAAVLVDLAPLMAAPPTPTHDDLPPGPPQEEAQPQREPQQQAREELQKIEPLPAAPNAEVVLPRPREKPQVKQKPDEKPNTAPPRPRPSTAQVADWHQRIVIHLQHYNSFPAAARAQGDSGVATVAFSIGRDGRLLSARLARSSHTPALDEAALATVRRAAPFPRPPDNLPGRTFDFMVPLGFKLR